MNQRHIAYVLLRFPCVTETFVAEEIRQVRREGVDVQIFSLLTPGKELMHPVSEELLPLTRYVPELHSPSLWAAHARILRKMPGRYARTLWALLREPSSRGASHILKRMVIFAKSVWVARELDGSPVELLHTHFAWLSAAGCVVIGQLLDLPVTVMAHAYDIYTCKSDLLPLAARAASRIVTISEYNRQAIRDLLEARGEATAAKIEVIHCGIDLGHFQRVDGRGRGDTFQITSVGSLIEKKGHEHLIRACSELAARGLRFECVIIGRGPLQASLQRLIDDLGLGDMVILAGTKSQQWVRERLSKSDLFVLACVVDAAGERDGIPVAMMEALAMRVPVVSTPVSGIPELIRPEDTGLLVPERDPGALAAAIMRLARDEPLRRQLGLNGCALVGREFDIVKNAAQLTALQERVIEERRGARGT